jgi:hypothetical protein
MSDIFSRRLESSKKFSEKSSQTKKIHAGCFNNGHLLFGEFVSFRTNIFVGPGQGDQIGPIFAYRTIVFFYISSFLKITDVHTLLDYFFPQ